MNMASAQAGKQLTGVVVSAGKMIKTVKVRIANREWNKKIQKVREDAYIQPLPLPFSLACLRWKFTSHPMLIQPTVLRSP